jgi:hypothetical protein
VAKEYVKRFSDTGILDKKIILIYIKTLTMPQLSNKADNENPKVHERGALLPLHQAQMTGGMDGTITLPSTPAISSSILGSGNTYYYDLEPDEVGRIDDLCFRFRITCSTSDVECLPPEQWFNRIVLECEKGSGDEVIHIYPENMVFWHWLTENRESREKSSKLCNYGRTEIKSESCEKYWINEQTKFKAGETRDIYLQIPALFLHLNALDMKHTRNDFRFRLEFSNDIVVSGDRTNLSVDSLDLVVQTFSEENYDHTHRMSRQRKNKHKYIYLDHEILSYNNYNLSAGQTQKFALDQFVGKCPFLFVIVKPNNSPVASDKSKINYVDLGNSTLDITNSSSQSLLGNGTAITAQYVNDQFTKQTGNPHLKGAYLINFAQSVKSSVAGKISGFFEFVGLRDYLEITFDTAPVQEVHTVNLASLGTTGSYRYAYENGAISDQEVSYDDVAADLKVAIDAMPQLKERDISVSVNGGIDDTTTQTITYNNLSGKVSQELGKITILGNNIPKVNSTTVSTVHQPGFVSGSNYTVEIHMYKFKCLEVAKNGRITCKDM